MTPTWEIWPCDQCGSPGVRNLGKRGYCAVHLHELYATFSPEAWIDGGVGLRSGPVRPEYGPLEADLTCCCCGATWTGIPGDSCWWCQRSREIQAEHQADLLLEPPDIDPDDVTYEERMKAWADRMTRGVEAGLIDQEQAERAWKRTLRARAA